MAYDLYTDPGDTSGVGDAISRITAVAAASSRGQNDANVLASYAYNGLARPVAEEFPEPHLRLDRYNDYDGNPTVGTYEGLDRFGRAGQRVWRNYNTNAYYVDRFSYGYDYNSNRLYRENNVTGDKKDELYAYDDLDRLTGFKRGNLNANKDDIPTTDGNRVRGEAWGLSAVGAWNDYQTDANGDGNYTGATDLDQHRTHNAVNEITGITEQAGPPQQAQWVAPAYDSCGNAVTMPRPGLPGRRRGKPGDPTASLACKYDAWNRLVEVKAGENLVAKYEYDGLGRRVKAHIDTSEPYNGTIDVYRHFYYNNQWQLLETRTDSENAEPEGLQPECQYVWSARYIDSPILRDKNTDTDGLCDDERLYYTTDANQNVTALTDTSGAAVERYVYDPYGKVTIYDGTWTNTRNTSSYANAILYCGYYRDGETGLYHVRNRVYNTDIGGWVQRDPLGYVDGASLYEYVGSCAVTENDPYGLEICLTTIPYETFWGVGAAASASRWTMPIDVVRPVPPIPFPLTLPMTKEDGTKGKPSGYDPRVKPAQDTPKERGHTTNPSKSKWSGHSARRSGDPQKKKMPYRMGGLDLAGNQVPNTSKSKPVRFSHFSGPRNAWKPLKMGLFYFVQLAPRRSSCMKYPALGSFRRVAGRKNG